MRNNRIASRNDLWLNDRGNGIHVWNSTGSLIEGNSVEGGRDGIYIEISNDNVIRGNRFENLRFAIHYMYANRNEISDNVSIRNHVGFALMYSDHLKVLRNVSISDLQHGLMLHTVHNSEAAENYIYGTGVKCLFVYTAANNDIHDNRFENCGVGMHFTGGSENNKVYGNQFHRRRDAGEIYRHAALRMVGERPWQLLERQSGLRSRWGRHRRYRLSAKHARRLGAVEISARQAPRVESRHADAALCPGTIPHALSRRRGRQLPADGARGAAPCHCPNMSTSRRPLATRRRWTAIHGR